MQYLQASNLLSCAVKVVPRGWHAAKGGAFHPEFGQDFRHATREDPRNQERLKCLTLLELDCQ
jgi:hypothetical protein